MIRLKFICVLAISGACVAQEKAVLSSEKLLNAGYALQEALYVKKSCAFKDVLDLLGTTTGEFLEASDGSLFPQYTMRRDGLACYVEPVGGRVAGLTNETVVHVFINLHPFVSVKWNDELRTKHGFNQTNDDFGSPYSKRDIKLGQFLDAIGVSVDDLVHARPHFGSFIFYTVAVDGADFYIKPLQPDKVLTRESVVDVVIGIPVLDGMADTYMGKIGWDPDGDFRVKKNVKANTVLSTFGLKLEEFKPLEDTERPEYLQAYHFAAQAGSVMVYAKTDGTPLNENSNMDALLDLDPIANNPKGTPSVEYLVKNGFELVSAPPYKEGTVYVRRVCSVPDMQRILQRGRQDFRRSSTNEANSVGPLKYVVRLGNAVCQIRSWPDTAVNLHKSLLYVTVFLDGTEFGLPPPIVRPAAK
jgi:hypothetical protein